MRFFLDNTMSPGLARAIAALEAASTLHTIEHLRDRFDPGTPDVVWIRKLGLERDWVIVSGDLRIMRNPGERAAWRESGLTAFFLKSAWADQPLWLYAARLVGRVRRAARSRRGPRGGTTGSPRRAVARPG